jgi:hypothetical protein
MGPRNGPQPQRAERDSEQRQCDRARELEPGEQAVRTAHERRSSGELDVVGVRQRIAEVGQPECLVAEHGQTDERRTGQPAPRGRAPQHRRQIDEARSRSDRHVRPDEDRRRDHRPERREAACTAVGDVERELRGGVDQERLQRALHAHQRPVHEREVARREHDGGQHVLRTGRGEVRASERAHGEQVRREQHCRRNLHHERAHG